MTDPHPLIGQINTAIGPGPLMDTALALCDDMECHKCGAICCPYGDAYHFHHDGCPTCAQESEAHGLHGSPARHGARPDGQDGISAVKDLSASASPATKEQQ